LNGTERNGWTSNPSCATLGGDAYVCVPQRPAGRPAASRSLLARSGRLHSPPPGTRASVARFRHPPRGGLRASAAAGLSPRRCSPVSVRSAASMHWHQRSGVRREPRRLGFDLVLVVPDSFFAARGETEPAGHKTLFEEGNDSFLANWVDRSLDRKSGETETCVG
jgi:hypothetical protein